MTRMQNNPLAHFRTLDAAQHADAIRRLAAAGMGDHELARVTGLHLAYVRQVLSERNA